MDADVVLVAGDVHAGQAVKIDMGSACRNATKVKGFVQTPFSRNGRAAGSPEEKSTYLTAVCNGPFSTVPSSLHPLIPSQSSDFCLDLTSRPSDRQTIAVLFGPGDPPSGLRGGDMALQGRHLSARQ